ncbi:MAG TPA: preprotein translocase subunit SecE [Pseudonocardiaceae bacterium]|nr:preprotein translocase subunit SecE [Pseudonocardiaceae bacterium]
MTEDHEQDQTEERDTAARPVTAAARRERRASARGEAPARRNVERKVEDKVPAGAKPRRRAADAEVKTAPDRKGVATPKRDRAEKQPSLVARTVKFIREVVAELRKVIWPTRRQQITYTLVVLVFVTVVVAFVSGLDLAFAKAVFAIFA